MDYKGKSTSCDPSVISSPNIKVSSYDFCEGNCTEEIIYGYLKRGPVLIGVDGENQNFRNYKSGIYNKTCHNLNHAVILVGYGTDKDTKKDYWLIRNSWGPDWGENGYVRIERNMRNNYSCFVTMIAFAPKLDKIFVSKLPATVDSKSNKAALPAANFNE